MAKQKAKKARYVVDSVGGGRGHSNTFNTLKKAIEFFYSKEYRINWQSFQHTPFIAKEVFYEFNTNEKTGKIEVKAIGDFPSRKPYFLIDEYQGTYDTYGGEVSGSMCEVTSYKTLSKLVKKGLPEVMGKPIITHGLELKLED